MSTLEERIRVVEQEIQGYYNHYLNPSTPAEEKVLLLRTIGQRNEYLLDLSQQFRQQQQIVRDRETNRQSQMMLSEKNLSSQSSSFPSLVSQNFNQGSGSVSASSISSVSTSSLPSIRLRSSSRNESTPILSRKFQGKPREDVSSSNDESTKSLLPSISISSKSTKSSSFETEKGFLRKETQDSDSANEVQSRRAPLDWNNVAVQYHGDPPDFRSTSVKISRKFAKYQRKISRGLKKLGISPHLRFGGIIPDYDEFNLLKHRYICLKTHFFDSPNLENWSTLQSDQKCDRIMKCFGWPREIFKKPSSEDSQSDTRK